MMLTNTRRGMSSKASALAFIGVLLGAVAVISMVSFATPPTGLAVSGNAVVSLSVTITKQGPVDYAWLAQMASSGQSWTYTVNPSDGVVTYVLAADPLITNQGHDFEQCAIFKAAGTITCTATDNPDVIYLSTGAAVPAATDTQAGTAGPCYGTAITSGLIISGGLAPVAGAVTAGAAGATVTTTIAHTFTAAETDTSVQASCLKTEANAGTNIYIYTEGTFGPDSLVSGNTLAITWTIART